MYMTGTDFLFEVIFSQILEEKKPKQINVTGRYTSFIKSTGSIPNCRFPVCRVQLADSQIADI